MYNDDLNFGQFYLVVNFCTSCRCVVPEYSHVPPISPVALLRLSRKRSEMSDLVFIA